MSKAQLADVRGDKTLALELSFEAYHLVASNDVWGNGGAFQVRISHAELLQSYGRLDEAEAQLRVLHDRTLIDLGVDSVYLLHLDRALAQNAALRGDFSKARTLQARAFEIAEIHGIAADMSKLFEHDATRWGQYFAQVGPIN